MTIKVYVEGGGDSPSLHNLCREGFRKFLQSAGLGGKMPRIVASGSRNAAYEDFKTAMRSRSTNELPLLLVDSEGPVAQESTPWQHLKVRDGWDRPPGANDDQTFLMVQAMETWLIADREALESFCRAGFRATFIPQWPDMESVEKHRVFEALDAATAHCGPRRYAKGKVSFKLLAVTRAEKVQIASRHAARFIQRLKAE